MRLNKMIIKTLRMVNFRRFKDVLIEFPDGLIGIVGKNGSGKTTILEAIAWVLYGIKASRTDKDQIKRSSAPLDAECLVEMEFKIGDHEYKINRVIQGRNNSGPARIFMDGGSNPEVNGVNEVTEYITKLIGLDHDSFIKSVFARQKELNALSTLKGGERKKMMLKLLKIHKIDDVIKNVRADSRDKNNKIEGITSMFKDLKIIDEELVKFEEEKSVITNKLNNKNQECTKIDQDYKNKKDEKIKLDKIFNEFTNLTKKIDLNMSSKTDKEQQLKTLISEINVLLKKKNEFIKIKPKENQYNKLLKIKSSEDIKKDKFEALSKKIEGLTNKISGKDDQIKNDKSRLNELLIHNKTLIKIEPKELEYKKNKSKEENMQACREKHNERLGLEKELNNITKDIDENKNNLKKYNNLIKNLSNTLKNLKLNKTQVKKNDIDLSENGKLKEKLNTEIIELKRQISIFNNKKDELNKVGKSGKCPLCTRPIHEYYTTIIAHFDEEINAIIPLIVQKKKEFDSVTEKLDELEKERKKLIQIKNNLENDDKKRNNIISSVNACTIQIKKLLTNKKIKDIEIKKLVKIKYDEKLHNSIKLELKELEKYHDQIVGLRKEISKIPGLKKNILLLGNEIKKLNLEKQNLDNDLKKIQFDEIAYAKLKQDLKELIITHEIFIGLKEEISKIPINNKKKLTLGNDIKLLSKTITLNKKLKNKLNFDNEYYEKLITLVDNLRETLNNKEKEIIEIKSNIHEIDKDISLNKKTKKEQLEMRDKIKDHQKEVAYLNCLEDILNRFKIDLISRIKPMISEKSSALLANLTNGKYTNIELDEDYAPLIEDEGELYPLSRFSGGEEDIVNLCLRIAISQVITERSGGSEINFIALDEIFGSQDEERKNNILKALNELTNQFRQIVLITHVEDIKDSLPNSITVREDEHGISSIFTEFQL
jgi:exonuclease SbcC